MKRRDVFAVSLYVPASRYGIVCKVGSKQHWDVKRRSHWPRKWKVVFLEEDEDEERMLSDDIIAGANVVDEYVQCSASSMSTKQIEHYLLVGVGCSRFMISYQQEWQARQENARTVGRCMSRAHAATRNMWAGSLPDAPIDRAVDKEFARWFCVLLQHSNESHIVVLETMLVPMLFPV